MTDWLIPCIALAIILYGLFKGVPVYEAFAAGAQTGLKSAVTILPNLAAMLIAIDLLTASGLLDALCRLLEPLLSLMHIPKEAAGLMLLRPFSGSGALAMLENIFAAYGPDSRVGLVASTLMGSSETIFYTLGIYMAAGRLTKSGCALPAALIAWLAGSWAAGLFY